MGKFQSVIDRMSFIEMEKLSKELQEKIAKRWEKPEGLFEAINNNIAGLKKSWAALSTEDWWRFCEELNCLCIDTRRMWRLIEKYNDHNEAVEKKAELNKVQQVFDGTLKFENINVNGRDYTVSGGKVVAGGKGFPGEEPINVPDDEIPF